MVDAFVHIIEILVPVCRNSEGTDDASMLSGIQTYAYTMRALDRALRESVFSPYKSNIFQVPAGTIKDDSGGQACSRALVRSSSHAQHMHEAMH